MEMPSTPAVPPRTWRYAFRTLGIKNVRLFFIGQSLSLLGTWSQGIALAWLVWRLTNSAWWLGFIGFATQIPVLFLGLIGGFVADRYPRLPLLICSQILLMVQAIILSILAYLGIVELWHIIALSLMLGVVYAFEFPLRQAFIMDMVGRENLINAVALNSAMIHSTRIIGPVIAGFIIGYWGEASCFAVNAASFICLIVALFIIDRALLIKQDKNGATIREAIAEGLHYIWSRPVMRAALIEVMLISGIGMIYVSLMPLFVGKIYGRTAVQLGWLMGSSGAGALAGALYLARRHGPHGLFELIIRCSIAFSALVFFFAWLQNVYLALIILSAMSFFLTILFSSANTFLQHEVPNQLRGRMMSIFTVTFFGLSPIGSIIGGAVAEVIGAPITVAASGIICLLISVTVQMRTKNRERIKSPHPPFFKGGSGGI
jgi:MFS family permease